MKWISLPLTASSVVSVSGVDYECIRGHQSSLRNQPGTGEEWESFWKTLTTTTGSAWTVDTEYLSKSDYKLDGNVLGIEDARIKEDDHGKFHLYKGIDPKKDQSYFLARLTQRHLAGARFPIGHMKKSDVIRLAEMKGFKPVKKTESQDVCFIKGKNYIGSNVVLDLN